MVVRSGTVIPHAPRLDAQGHSVLGKPHRSKTGGARPAGNPTLGLYPEGRNGTNNLIQPDEAVPTRAQILKLGDALEPIHEFFAEAYYTGDPDDFSPWTYSSSTTTGAATGSSSGSSRPGLISAGETSRENPIRFDILETWCYSLHQARFRETVWTGALQRFSAITTLGHLSESAKTPR